MKLYLAELITETNTFVSTPTGRDAYLVHHGDASTVDPQGAGALLAEWRRLAEVDGHDVLEGLFAYAQPLGRTVQAVYESFCDEITGAVRDAIDADAPFDAVLLFLHGAMVAERSDDCEGELLTAIRALVGPRVPIGVELDLHCHFTEAMRASADVIVCFKEYPHVDGMERAREVYDLTLRTARGEIRPATAMYDCRMVSLWHTTREPMIGFVRRMQALEGRDGVLSVSFGHGFPWGDTADSGAKVWVVTDDDASHAARVASMLGRELWDLREATRPVDCGIDEALDEALAHPDGPCVLADVADNPGGGAPGDSTFILQRLIERGIGNVAIGAFWDVGAIRICREAGVGARFDLRVGGKVGPTSGEPVDLTITVRAIDEALVQSSQGHVAPMGAGVWVSTDDGIDLLLASMRGQVFGTDAFTNIGIDLFAKKIVVVKSTQHFHAEFAPIAAGVRYVSTPGGITPDFANIPYRRRSLAYWPRVEDPFAATDHVAASSNSRLA